MKKTYLFYDTETTGLNKSFDQVLQFAAIRTDLDLNEIERHEILVKLNRDVVPAPGAVITHRLGVDATADGLPEFEAISQIHELMNTPGTISIGYNTLGFDDEFLRFSFYRNLLPAYTHQYAAGCSRMDLYPMAALYFLYQPDVIDWPEVNGRPSLKLENINLANQFVDGTAHDAMVDVEVTLALAIKLKSAEKMWDYVCGYFNKRTDQQRMTKLEQALLIDGIFGPDLSYQSAVISLGTHWHYKNQSLWLRLDKPELAKTTPDTIAKNTWAVHKKPGEPGLLLPIEKRFMQYLDKSRCDVIAANETWLAENPQLAEQIKTHHLDYKYPKVPNLDIDGALYDIDFPTPTEMDWCRKFHQLAAKDKAKHLEKSPNPRLKAQAARVLGRNYPDYLPDAYQAEFAEHLLQLKPAEDTRRLNNFKGKPRLSVAEALSELAKLEQADDLDAEQMALLGGLKVYLLAF